MKYTIEGFQQEKLLELGLDATDAVLLRWFTDFSGSGEMTEKIINGRAYYWVWYKKVLQDLPVLCVKTKDSLYRRFRKMCAAGVLDQHVDRKGTDKGATVYFCKGKNFAALVKSTDEGSDLNPTGGRKNIRPGVGYRSGSDSSSTDSSSKHKPTTTQSPQSAACSVGEIDFLESVTQAPRHLKFLRDLRRKVEKGAKLTAYQRTWIDDIREEAQTKLTTVGRSA